MSARPAPPNASLLGPPLAPPPKKSKRKKSSKLNTDDAEGGRLVAPRAATIETAAGSQGTEASTASAGGGRWVHVPS